MTDMMDSEAVESTAIEFFWGQELSSKNKTYEYTGESDEEEGIETTLEFRGACLGTNAKNERNVVNITTENMDGESVSYTILSMRLEKNEQVPLYLTVKPPVKLELVQGSGPVHIVGNLTSVLSGELSENEMDDDSEEEEEEEEEVEETKPVVAKPQQKKKRQAETPLAKPAKKKKNVPVDSEEEDSDEEDSAMDASYDFAPQLKKSLVDDSNEEDEEDEEGDDDSYEDNDGEDSEEEEAKPVVKKGAKGPQKNKLPKGLSQTPVPKKPIKSASKQPASAPRDSKKGAKGGTPSIDQIKKRLITSPGLPKKLEKFNNMLKNNYKINDDNTRKELWEYVQKSKK